jgi:hypothetical protein
MRTSNDSAITPDFQQRTLVLQCCRAAAQLRWASTGKADSRNEDHPAPENSIIERKAPHQFDTSGRRDRKTPDFVLLSAVVL